MSGLTKAQIAVGTVALAAGVAFLNLGAKYRALQQSEEVRTVLGRTSASIEAVFRELGTRAAEATTSRGAESDESDLVCWTPTSSWGDARPSRAWLEQFDKERAEPGLVRWPNVAGPYRADDGSFRIVVRVPATGARALAADSPWCGLSFRLETALARSDLRAISDGGYSYLLRYEDPVYDEAWDVATVGSLGEITASGEIDYTDGRWMLTVSRAQPFAWQSIAVGLGSLAVFLIVALATTRDYGTRLELSQQTAAMAKGQTKRIRGRLLDEARRRRALDRQFAHAAYHDAPTGLPNDSFLLNRLERALQRIRVADAGGIAVLHLHPLQFEAVVAACSHGSPDLILVEVAQRVEGCLRPSDLVVARSGMDITVLLYEVSSVEPALAAAQRILETFEESLQGADAPLYLKVRIGVSHAATGLEQPREILRHASIAAMVGGDRPGVQVFDQTVSEELVSLQQLESDLRGALDRGDFVPYFQPIVSIDNEQIVGFEMLLRWRHPRLGVLTPDRFLGVAEETGIVQQITRWLVQDACARIREWQDRLPPSRSFYFGVNLSPSDLRESDLANFVVQQIRGHGIPPSALRLEVTEGAMIENVAAAGSLMSRLRSEGVALMLDDFGAGYSSLGYLNRFRFDFLKLDRSFIQRMAPENESGQIVGAVVDLAHGLGMKVVAEGIETSEIARNLRAMGCDYGQGYFYARPMPAEEAFERLSKGLNRVAAAGR